MDKPVLKKQFFGMDLIRKKPASSALRFRWLVRDCVFCRWRPLTESYTAEEMGYIFKTANSRKPKA